MPATEASNDIDQILREVGSDSTATFDNSPSNPTEHAGSENVRYAAKDDEEDVEDDEDEEDEDLDDEDDLDEEDEDEELEDDEEEDDDDEDEDEEDEEDEDA